MDVLFQLWAGARPQFRIAFYATLLAAVLLL